jgi:hypothetical protein
MLFSRKFKDLSIISVEDLPSRDLVYKLEPYLCHNLSPSPYPNRQNSKEKRVSRSNLLFVNNNNKKLIRLIHWIHIEVKNKSHHHLNTNRISILKLTLNA